MWPGDARNRAQKSVYGVSTFTLPDGSTYSFSVPEGSVWGVEKHGSHDQSSHGSWAKGGGGGGGRLLGASRGEAVQRAKAAGKKRGGLFAKIAERFGAKKEEAPRTSGAERLRAKYESYKKYGAPRGMTSWDPPDWAKKQGAFDDWVAPSNPPPATRRDFGFDASPQRPGGLYRTPFDSPTGFTGPE